MTPAPRRIDPGIRSLCCVLVAALALGACGTPNAQSLLLVIEGHDNHVELRKANDEVRDQGSGNRISGPPSNRKAKNHDLDPYRRILPSGSDRVGAARVMGMDDELGPVASGKLADLILVDGGQDRFRRTSAGSWTR